MSSRDPEVEEAAWVLFIINHSLPAGTRQSVVEAIEREERVFIRVPRKKRTLRIPVSPPSCSSSSFTAVDVESETSEEDPPKAEPPRRTTRNSNKCPLLSPPREKPPKKARRKGSFQVRASNSAGTREPTPEWLDRLMTVKNGENLKYIISKRGLEATDVAKNNNRLAIPVKQIVDSDGFLTPAEERIIEEKRKGIRAKGVDTILVTSDLREFELNLRLWDMGGRCPIYNLVTKWNQVVEACRLKEDDHIHLWSFHANGQLYFAMELPQRRRTISSAIV